MQIKRLRGKGIFSALCADILQGVFFALTEIREIDMGKRKVSVKQILSRTGTIVLLKNMIKGLESGSIVVGEGDSPLEFSVTDQIEVEFKGKVKRDKVKVSVSLGWRQAAEVPAERPEAAVPAEKNEVKVPAKKEEAKTPAKKYPARKPVAKKKLPTKKTITKKKTSDKAAEKSRTS